jgi:hypothetical protein
MSERCAHQFLEIEGQLERRFPEVYTEALQLAETVVDPQTAGPDEIWPVLWRKPLYANTKVEIAQRWIDRLSPYMPDAWRHWGEEESLHIRRIANGTGTNAFELVSPLAQKVQSETRIAPHRLYAIQGGAIALRNRASRADLPYADIVSLDLGELVEKVRGELGFGWGPVTTLHFLTDLGLAIKPDLHLTKTCNYFASESGKRMQNPTDPIEINRWVRSLVEELDGSCTPQRLRYVDKVLMEISKRGLIPAEVRT